MFRRIEVVMGILAVAWITAGILEFSKGSL